LWKDIIDGPDVSQTELFHDIEFHAGIFNCIKNGDTKSVRPLMMKRFNEIQKRIE